MNIIKDSIITFTVTLNEIEHDLISSFFDDVIADSQDIPSDVLDFIID